MTSRWERGTGTSIVAAIVGKLCSCFAPTIIPIIAPGTTLTVAGIGEGLETRCLTGTIAVRGSLALMPTISATALAAHSAPVGNGAWCRCCKTVKNGTLLKKEQTTTRNKPTRKSHPHYPTKYTMKRLRTRRIEITLGVLYIGMKHRDAEARLVSFTTEAMFG